MKPLTEHGYKKVNDTDYNEWWAKEDEDGKYSYIKIHHLGHVEIFGSLEEAEAMLEYAKWLKDFNECL